MSRVEKLQKGYHSAGLKRCVQIPHPWSKFDKTFSSVIYNCGDCEGSKGGVIRGNIFIFSQSYQLGRQVSLMAYLPCYNLGCFDKRAEIHKGMVKKLCAA